MINVSVETDIRKAIEFLNLLPKEANRAGARSLNKIADEVKKDSISRIAGYTGVDVGRVADRFYVQPAKSNRLIAVVKALPSARNVGYEKGANPTPGKAGVTVRAWRSITLYDRTFVKGKQGNVGVRRKVWKRTGPGRDDIDSRVWGPSVPRTLEQPWMVRHNLDTIQTRWPYYFERYLRAEIVRLRGADALRGVRNVAPFIAGPQVTSE